MVITTQKSSASDIESSAVNFSEKRIFTNKLVPYLEFIWYGQDEIKVKHIESGEIIGAFYGLIGKIDRKNVEHNIEAYIMLSDLIYLKNFN